MALTLLPTAAPAAETANAYGALFSVTYDGGGAVPTYDSNTLIIRAKFSKLFAVRVCIILPGWAVSSATPREFILTKTIIRVSKREYIIEAS